MIAQIKSLKDIQEQLLSLVVSLNTYLNVLHADIAALKATTESYFAVRSRFFAVFIRDKVGKTSRADQKLINEGNFAAQGGDPLTNAIMFKKKIRADNKTFGLLYSMTWARVMEYGIYLLLL